MQNTFIPRGMEIVKQAVQADQDEDFEKALNLYQSALKYFVTGLKYVPNERSKQAIRDRMAQYLSRAEEIKASLASGKNKKKVVNEGGHEDDKENEDGVDPEAKKLQDALSGAIVKETPNVRWDDVAGLETAKMLLKEAVIFPIRFPQLFTGKRKPWAGILLYGPPGTGKSYIAKAVATEAGSSCFLSVSSSDLVSKFQGESERLVRNLFELARQNAPSIIFIDEVDSLCGARDDSGGQGSSRRIITEFLVQMQGVGKGNEGVLVLGATNTPWDLDSAIRRRFQKRVYIPLPEQVARQRLFEIHVGNTPNTLSPRDFRRLAKKTKGLSGSDIEGVVREALFEPVRACQEATYFKQVVDPEPQKEGMLQKLQKNNQWREFYFRLFVDRLEMFSADSKGKGEPMSTVSLVRGDCKTDAELMMVSTKSKSAVHVLKSGAEGEEADDDQKSWVEAFRLVTTGDTKKVWEPCEPRDRGAKKMNMMEMDGSCISTPKVSFKHFLSALKSAKPSVGPNDLTKLEQWTKQFGQDG